MDKWFQNMKRYTKNNRAVEKTKSTKKQLLLEETSGDQDEQQQGPGDSN
jgi:hypothetical protein